MTTTTTPDLGTVAATQAATAFSAMATFFANKSAAGSSGSFPEVKDLAVALDNADLISFAMALSNAGPSFQVGGAVEAVHLVSGIQREYALLSKTKETYFEEISTEGTEDSICYQENSARFSSLIKGISSEMSPT